MTRPEIPGISDRLGLVFTSLVMLLLCLAPPSPAATAQPWNPPADPADIPLPRSARLGASGEGTARSLARGGGEPGGEATPAGYETVRGVTEVLAGDCRAGAARLAAHRSLAAWWAHMIARPSLRQLGLPIETLNQQEGIATNTPSSGGGYR